ncbi:MAG: cysteine--tRNA ligase [Candidatus Obscuribacterales bacterium]|nr:cysteine--tRNA ligase [Candidatus Obscuribacterales bacterium]
MPLPIQLFNSLGRELKEFKPLTPGQVLMYSCGPTVYNFAHIGNLRAYIFTDTLRRVLQWKGFDVQHVMNITDVGHLTSDADEGEDKMEQSASKQGKTVWEIAQFYTDNFLSDLEKLNILTPTTVCKATDNIQEMIDFAKKLDEKGFTYVLDDGLYFDISKLSEYGKIALLDLEGQEAGARVAVKAGKRNPADFAIWRFSPKDQKRLMEWDSPWGVGAPGWHLECSVMSINELGNQFDIHTGGIDHRQVHHCNEIAQNQAYLGNNNPGATWWIHNEFLVLSSDEKMSKSAGNFLRLQSIIDLGIHPLVYRFFCLQASYRTPLEFSIDALMSAKTGLTRLIKRIEAIKITADVEAMELVDALKIKAGESLEKTVRELSKDIPAGKQKWITDFDAAISDDLNTAKALALLNEVIAESEMPPHVTIRIIAIYDLVLGLNLVTQSSDGLALRPANAKIDESEINSLITQRTQAKKDKDFAKADQLRNELTSKGVAIKDSKDGTTWEWLPDNN